MKLNLKITEAGFINTKTEDGFELCVMCWNPTDVKADTPINERKNYASGNGQYCEDCSNPIKSNLTYN